MKERYTSQSNPLPHKKHNLGMALKCIGLITGAVKKLQIQ